MFTNIKIENFQSLVNLEVDLLKTNNNPKKMIVIYGENGVGKTNFATTFHMLLETIRTMSIRERLVELLEKDKDKKEFSFFESIIKDYYSDTESIIKKYKTQDSNENMFIEYKFKIKSKKGTYHLEYNNFELVSERLDYVLNSNQICFFNITNNKDKTKINEKIFTNKQYYKQFDEELNKYWGKHSFLSILYNEIDDKKRGYVKKNVAKELFDVLFFFLSVNTKIKNKNKEFGVFGTSNKNIHDFCTGKISVKEENVLDKTAIMLKQLFTNMYSDIKDVYYKKEFIDNKINYQLYVKKLVYNNLLEINFVKESTGTQNLLDLIPYILQALKGNVVIIDEMDSGIHDILINNLLKNIKEYIKGQLIITTHNTLLLESALSKENIYIFIVNHNAEKKLIPLTSFDERQHKNFNMRKRYLTGLYGGIPYTTDIDFDEIANYLKD